MTTTFSETAREAVMQLNEHLLEQELSRGIDVDATNDAGDTLLHLAAEWGNPTSIRMLVAAGADLNRQDATGRTALYRAVLHKSERNACALIDAGADLNIPDTDNMTALYRAIYIGEIDIASLLVDRGAEVNIEANRDGGTPLLWAAGLQSLDLVRALVRRGADIHHPGVLQSAASRRQIAHLEFFLEQGADINVKNRYGATCLHIAARDGALEILDWLLERGADPTARDERELTPLDWAVDSMRDEAAETLRKRMANLGVAPSSVYDVKAPTDAEGIALLERTRAFLHDYEKWNAAACDLSKRDRRASRNPIREQFAALLRKYGVQEGRKGLTSYSRDCNHSASNEQLWRVRIEGSRGVVYSRMRGRFSSVIFYEYEFVRRNDTWALEQVWTVLGPTNKEPLIVEMEAEA